MNRISKRSTPDTNARRYMPPAETAQILLADLLRRCGRPGLMPRQTDLLRGQASASSDVPVFYSGELSILEAPAVSIVGTRDVSDEGKRRATRLASGLAKAGITVVSGLAKGVDTAAHLAAMEHGATAAVIGTPLSKAYPAENLHLQERIYSQHILLSPFAEGSTVYKANFPARNRVMAAVTDATIIVEASDTSGTLHQAAECLRLGRWLFILQSVADDRRLTWPEKFLNKPNVSVLTNLEDVIARITN